MQAIAAWESHLSHKSEISNYHIYEYSDFISTQTLHEYAELKTLATMLHGVGEIFHARAKREAIRAKGCAV
jgi:hypothetical protein